MDLIRDNSQRAQNVIYALVATGIVNIISIGFGLYENTIYETYETEFYSEDFLNNLDLALISLSVVQIAVFLATIVVFIMWFRRAYGNLIRIDIPMQYMESGVVWGFFIPFVNWVRPITTAKEMYLKSQRTIKGSSEMNDDVSFVYLWWLSYLSGGLFANIVSRIYRDAITLEEIIQANTLYIYADIWDTVAVIFAILFVRKMAKTEQELKEKNQSKMLNSGNI